MKLSTFTLLAVLAAGCNSGPPPADGPAPAIPEDAAPTQVNFNSTDLQQSIRIGTVVRTIDGNGIMHLTVPVRAVTEYDLTVDYRFTYLDESRALVDQPASWQARTLHAGTFEYIQATAPSPRARDFVLDLRHAQ
jgi:hypothetical protein